MASCPAEIVFSLPMRGDPGIKEKELFYRYDNGPEKVPGPWKRGRPKGARNKGGRNIIEAPHSFPRNVFEFVNISQQHKEISHGARNVIRKHARSKRFRLEKKGELKDNRPQSLGIPPKPNFPQIPGVDPFNIGPIKLEPYMHDLLFYFATTVWKRFYSIEELAGCNPIAEYWLPLAFQDSALINSFIACAAIFTSGYTTVQDASKGLKHLHEAISIVNQRLMDGKDMTSKGTLSVIAGIAMIEKGSGRHDHWRMHMQGLIRLVDLCGGLESLSSEPLILDKIYRSDLCGALDAAQSPFFEKPYISLSQPGKIFLSEGFHAFDKTMTLDKTLRTCLYQLEEVTLFWSKVDNNYYEGDDSTKKKASTPAEAARVRYLLTNVQYTLVSITFGHGSHKTLESQISEFLRICLILYSLTILNEHPRSTSIGLRLCDFFRASIETKSPTDMSGTFHDKEMIQAIKLLPADFLLWALFLAAIVMKAAKSETKAWILKLFGQLCLTGHSQIHDWEELRSRMSRYLWVPSIHDSNSWWLWCETEQARGQSKEKSLCNTQD